MALSFSKVALSQYHNLFLVIGVINGMYTQYIREVYYGIIHVNEKHNIHPKFYPITRTKISRIPSIHTYKYNMLVYLLVPLYVHNSI